MTNKNTAFDVQLFFDSVPQVDQRTMALRAFERLMELGEVRYREPDIEPDGTRVYECLYWVSSGEDLRVPF